MRFTIQHKMTFVVELIQRNAYERERVDADICYGLGPAC